MAKKFGTFKGVFVPSVEAILGTVLFIIMPALTADIGLLYMIPVVLLAHSVTLATAFSISDCATNLTKIEGGGMYALAKRSLGSAFGGSIGFFLYIAQAASVGFYCYAFSLAMLDLINATGLQQFNSFSWFFLLENSLQISIIGSAVYFFSFVVVLIGADFTLKIQTFILVVLGASILCAFVIPFINPKIGEGFSFQPKLNLFGSRDGGVTPLLLVTSFTLFFPAVTGISTGVGMSGDLKNPRKSIVQGTFLSIFVTLIIYLAITILFSFLDSSSVITGYSGEGSLSSPFGRKLYELAGLDLPFPGNLVGILILAGVFFATGSSALSLFMTGPRTLQHLAIDGLLLEKLSFLANDFRKGGDEPRFAVLMTAIVGYGMIWLPDINIASMVVGSLFLLVYGWVNGAAFLERISQNPTFRPTSKNHWIISLYGFLACIAAVMIFQWVIGLVMISMMFFCFWLLLKFRTAGKVEGVWWGVTFTFMTGWLNRLNKMAGDSKNWRPVLSAFAFCDKGTAWKGCANIAEDIASYKGLVSLNLLHIPKRFDSLLDLSDVTVPTHIITTDNPFVTISSVLESSNPIGIDINTVLLEYAEKADIVKITRQVLDSGKHLLLLKNGDQVSSQTDATKELSEIEKSIALAGIGAKRLLLKKRKVLLRQVKQESVVGRLDIWWRGQKNGNLMVLLAYIINKSRRQRGEKPYQIRVLRSLARGQLVEEERLELIYLLQTARLEGEVEIVPYENKPFIETLQHYSGDCSLIMMGLPGNYVENQGRRLFNFNEYFFGKELEGYNHLPAVLFVKSASEINLLED